MVELAIGAWPRPQLMRMVTRLEPNLNLAYVITRLSGIIVTENKQTPYLCVLWDCQLFSDVRVFHHVKDVHYHYNTEYLEEA